MPVVFTWEMLTHGLFLPRLLAVNLFLLPMHSSISLFKIISYVHSSCVFDEVAIRLE